MLRNDAYWFSRLGVYVERADNTARILDVKYHLLLPAHERVGGPLDYFQWAAILRSVSALTAYHWVYRESLKPWLIADLLILKDADAALARELLRATWCAILDRIGARLWPPGSGAASGPRHAARGSRTAAWTEIFQHGLHEFIAEFIADNNATRRRDHRAVSDLIRERADVCWTSRLVTIDDARMRIGVEARDHYRYDAPPTGVIQTLRLTPRNHEGQYVRRLADRGLGRLPARPAGGCVRQHHPRVHGRRRRSPI